MEKELILRVNGNDVTISAHEILDVALRMMKDNHEQVVKRRRPMKGPFDGSLSSPTTISEDPIDWLHHATLLEQGATRDEKEEYKQYLEKHNELVKEEAIRYYKDKIQTVIEEKHRDFTMPIWNFREKRISQVVSDLETTYRDYKNFLKEFRKALVKINAYLSLSPPEFDPSDSESDFFLDTPSKEETQDLLAFYELFTEAYSEKISKKTLSSFLYYLRKIIKHIATDGALTKFILKNTTLSTEALSEKNVKEILAELESRKQLFYDNDPAVSVLYSYNIIAELIGISTVDTLFACELDTVAGFVKHMENLNPHMQFLRDSLIIELRSCIPHSKNAFKTKLHRDAMYMVYKRRELYSLYNTILFVREIERQGKYRFDTCKSNLDRLRMYLKLVNEILSSDKELKRGKKRTDHYPVQGPSKYFTFLRLMVRSGFSISSVDELAIATVFDAFQKYKSPGCVDLDCCEYLTFSNKVKERLPWPETTHRDSSFEYFRVGTRILGANNHGDRYVYDFGSAKDLFVDIVRHLKDLRKNILSDIKWLFAFNTFEIYEVNDQDSTRLIVKYILILKDLLEQYNQQTSSAYKNILNRAGNTGVIVENIIQFYKGDINVNEFLNKICSIIDLIQSNYYKLKNIEIKTMIMVRNVVDNILIDIQSICRLVSKKDENVVTYRAIYRHLPSTSVLPFARSVRGLVQGGGISCHHTGEVTKSNKSLPVLVGAWYLAETSRNPMTLLTSAMLLDLMESQGLVEEGNNYSVENVLWHSDTIGNRHPDGTDLSALDKTKRTRKYPQAEGWGGKHPMCHNGSYMKDFSEGKLWHADDELSVVRQKEVSILIRWLFFMIKQFFSDLSPKVVEVDERTKDESLYLFTEEKELRLPFKSYSISRQDFTTALAREMLSKLIEPLFMLRMTSFDNMVIPHAKIPKPISITLPFVQSLFTNTICLDDEEKELRDMNGITVN